MPACHHEGFRPYKNLLVQRPLAVPHPHNQGRHKQCALQAQTEPSIRTLTKFEGSSCRMDEAQRCRKPFALADSTMSCNACIVHFAQHLPKDFVKMDAHSLNQKPATRACVKHLTVHEGANCTRALLSTGAKYGFAKLATAFLVNNTSDSGHPPLK